MAELRKFIVALDEDDAVHALAIWRRHDGLRESLADKVFDEREAADAALADLIRRALDDSPFGCPVPCDEHSRCVGFTPGVYEVTVSVTLKSK